MKYTKGVLGGTFDHFHVGHQQLINAAFSESENIIIGITTEKLYKNKLLSESIEDYKTRAAAVKDYLTKKDYISRATIIPLTDIFGPSLTEKNLDAIYVTSETEKGAEIINTERIQRNLQTLAISTVPLVTGPDKKSITSERIRLGEIDRNGVPYTSIFANKKMLLPETLRETLRIPIGEIVTDMQHFTKEKLLITVGDIVTLSFLKKHVQPAISIIDFKTRRHTLSDKELQMLSSLSTISFTNPSGTINTTIATKFKTLVNNFLKNNQRQTLAVKGEEDLLTLPIILLAPLNSLVFYGQYDLGAVMVKVTEEKKEYIKRLLEQFI